MRSMLVCLRIFATVPSHSTVFSGTWLYAYTSLHFSGRKVRSSVRSSACLHTSFRKGLPRAQYCIHIYTYICIRTYLHTHVHIHVHIMNNNHWIVILQVLCGPVQTSVSELSGLGETRAMAQAPSLLSCPSC